MTGQSPRIVGSRCSFIRSLPSLSQIRMTSSSSNNAVVYALPPAESATSMVQMLVANDVQVFRDAFRALFFPGIAIITFGLPLILAGLMVQKKVASPPAPGGVRGKGTASLPSTSPSVPQMPPFSSVLLGKLLVSIIIDLIGDGSLLVPGFGDASDFLWAPVSALLVRLMYGSNVLAAVNLLEELLPFTDVIPTATIAFLLEFFFRKAEAEDMQQAQQRQGGGRRKNDNAADVLDVKATVIGEDDDMKKSRK